MPIEGRAAMHRWVVRLALVSASAVLGATLACNAEAARAPASSASPTATATATATAQAACPPQALLEAVHAAAFHFEHGSAVDAHEMLVEARRLRDTLSPESVDPTLQSVLERLAAADQASRAADEVGLRTETEYARLSFRDWSCMSETLHQRFHETLGPVPR